MQLQKGDRSTAYRRYMGGEKPADLLLSNISP
jgi:hypothetical protein